MKIMKDYAKKNPKEIGAKIFQPSHDRNEAGPMSGYFSQKEDIIKYEKIFHSKDKDLLFTNENPGLKKKGNKKNNKNNKNIVSAIYDTNSFSQWNTHQPLSQKAVNNAGFVLRDKSNNKKHTPSKIKGSKNSSKKLYYNKNSWHEKKE